MLILVDWLLPDLPIGYRHRDLMRRVIRGFDAYCSRLPQFGQQLGVAGGSAGVIAFELQIDKGQCFTRGAMVWRNNQLVNTTVPALDRADRVLSA